MTVCLSACLYLLLSLSLSLSLSRKHTFSVSVFVSPFSSLFLRVSLSFSLIHTSWAHAHAQSHTQTVIQSRTHAHVRTKNHITIFGCPETSLPYITRVKKELYSFTKAVYPIKRAIHVHPTTLPFTFQHIPKCTHPRTHTNIHDAPMTCHDLQ